MPPTPARILRVIAESLPNGRYRPSARDLERQDRILDAAEAMFIQCGRAAITMAYFATALRMSPATIRRHFCDLDSILAEILLRHLRAIAKAIGDIPADAPNRHAAARAAYLAATRTPYNAPTDRHLLLLRDRHTLPPDLAEPVENLRASIGALLATDRGDAALTLLDSPAFDAAEIDSVLSPAATRHQAALHALLPPSPPALAPPDADPALLRSLHRSTSLSPLRTLQPPGQAPP